MSQKPFADKSRLETVVEPICKAHGLELVDVRFAREPGGAVVRVLVDREGHDPADKTAGVTLEECRLVSRDIATAFDVHDFIDGHYNLEVGSPGLDRPLVKLKDFERFAGREIKLESRVPVQERRKFNGLLRGIDGELVVLEQDGREVKIPHGDISKANLVFKF